MSFPHYKQHDHMDCGPTCLRIISKFYGKNHSLQKLRELCEINREGVSLLGISIAAEKIGFRSSGVRIHLDQLKKAELPCIIHWRHLHFVVLYKIKKDVFYISDPAKGLITFPKEEFVKYWGASNEFETGVALLLSTTPRFHDEEGDLNPGLTWSILLKYRLAYGKLIFQLILGLGIGSILQLITPFLTQAIVDIGINTRNVNFLFVILMAQTMVFLGSTSVGFIRSWIMLHMTTRINVAILTDFLAKLMRLPMKFFDNKMAGDILQRMQDHSRIEHFLAATTLNTFFSLANMVVFGIALAYYNSLILVVFVISTCLYSLWILIFMRRRRELDFKQFDNLSANQSNMIELIAGIQDIKLHNCEQQKRWNWEHIQARLFKFSIKSLALSQYQQAGTVFINQGKNILILFISAKAVIDGNLTLGGMMAIQFMVGQLNSPIEQLLGLIQGYQDAKISLERLNEVHQMEDEEGMEKEWVSAIPKDKSIKINNLSFKYPGASNQLVLNKINLEIPQGKTTAIVGMSGSGKTTILKLLMRFYLPESGNIEVGKMKLNHISFKVWRDHCGIVLQNGYIFSDTITNNIVLSEEYPDSERLKKAIQLSNIEDFIDSLPLGLNTKIGSGGNGISQGQKQRILIARAIYKNPEYLFFDEATNALDTNNEGIIIENLREFFKGRTVVVVAHRLSTVRNADNIIVLKQGAIVEQGTHEQLAKLGGEYYLLVKNQLEFSL